jgi:hypothetical protein
VAQKSVSTVENIIAWEELKNRYPKQPCLDDDTVYSLPTDLIKAIKKHLPSLWSKEDLKFEYDLNEIAGMGLYLKQPFHYPLLQEYFHPLSEAAIKFQEEHERVNQKIQEATIEDMKSYGCSDLTINNYFKQREQYKVKANERQKGYAGWIVTSPEFQIQKAAFINQWEDQIKKRGEFPSIPPMDMINVSTPIQKNQRPFYAEYTRFYYDWCLETLTTPYLPLPMHSNPVGYSQYSQDVFAGSGVTLFVPWYLLADQDLNLRDIVKHQLSYGHKKHLNGWLDKYSKDRQKWGYERFAIMLKMFTFLEYGLYARYKGRLNRKVKKINEAFTEFLEGKALDGTVLDRKLESTRKIRLELKRRLNRCTKAVDIDSPLPETE